MRVKEKLSEGRRTTPQETRKQLKPIKKKTSKKRKSMSPGVESIRGSVRSRTRSA